MVGQESKCFNHWVVLSSLSRCERKYSLFVLYSGSANHLHLILNPLCAACFFAQIAVPQPLVGHIIGKGGTFVREVLNHTGVQVRNHPEKLVDAIFLNYVRRAVSCWSSWGGFWWSRYLVSFDRFCECLCRAVACLGCFVRSLVRDWSTLE